jgi:signal peptidase I
MSENGEREQIAPRREGIKDTVESIVIALILAFVFRAFVVEAFVIPTGSMAPTLYGAHGTILCEDCGTEFAYGLRDLDDTRQTTNVGPRSEAVCPNCNHANSDLPVTDQKRNPERGDRILVLKWPFDIGGPLLDPERWDVIVFKDPADGTTNFIKRLAGLPNEVLMILDGDVYTVPVSELSPETLAELERNRHEKHELTAGMRQGALQPVSAEAFTELEQKLRIARKTQAAQAPLWFPVFNNDYPPQTPDDVQPRWSAALERDSGWDTRERRVRFTDRQRTGDYIELKNKDFRAISAYNIHRQSAPAVSDHRVQFVLTPQGETGRVMVRLSKWNRFFWVVLQTDGVVTLYESGDIPTDATPAMASKRLSPFVPGKAVQVAFENVDYGLAVSVGGEQVLASSSDPASPAFYGPNVKLLRQTRKDPLVLPPRIYAQGGDFELTHIMVERDEHYYHDGSQSGLGKLPWAPRGGWASSTSPILLRGHEYFMLGDNTAASKDSRLWDDVGPHLRDRGEGFQLGTVPRDQLIGKAFFVYWPSGHRLEWLPLLDRWGIVPDVGRMRWIR